jgi:hypothetical protein
MEAKVLIPITLFDMTALHQRLFLSLRDSYALSCSFLHPLLSNELATVYVQGRNTLPPITCSTPPQGDKCAYRNVSTDCNSEALEKKRYWLFTSLNLPRSFTLSLLQQVFSTLSRWVAQLFGKDPKKDGDKPKPEKQKPGTQPEKKKARPEREGGRDPREPRQPKTRGMLTFLSHLAVLLLRWVY